MPNGANENRRPQPWWAKLLEKVGLGSKALGGTSSPQREKTPPPGC